MSASNYVWFSTKQQYNHIGYEPYTVLDST